MKPTMISSTAMPRLIWNNIKANQLPSQFLSVLLKRIKLDPFYKTMISTWPDSFQRKLLSWELTMLPTSKEDSFMLMIRNLRSCNENQAKKFNNTVLYNFKNYLNPFNRKFCFSENHFFTLFVIEFRFHVFLINRRK